MFVNCTPPGKLSFIESALSKTISLLPKPKSLKKITTVTTCLPESNTMQHNVSLSYEVNSQKFQSNLLFK